MSVLPHPRLEEEEVVGASRVVSVYELAAAVVRQNLPLAHLLRVRVRVRVRVGVGVGVRVGVRVRVS